MGLRDVVAVRIPVRTPPATRATLIASPAPASAGGVVLDVQLVKQTQDEWCWAACTEMVATYLELPPPSQCELANFLNDQTSCCVKPGSSKCNQPCPFESVVPVYHHVGVTAINEALPSSMDTVVRELNAGRPLEVAYLWNGGQGGHVAIIYGITANKLLLVHDPWYGSLTVTYSAVRMAYGMGLWVRTYGVFKKAAA